MAVAVAEAAEVVAVVVAAAAVVVAEEVAAVAVAVAVAAALDDLSFASTIAKPAAAVEPGGLNSCRMMSLFELLPFEFDPTGP